MKIEYRVIIIITVILTIFISCSENSVKSKSDKNDHKRTKFEPPNGQVLFILGQADNEEMKAYIDEVKSTPPPAGFAYYTSLSGNAIDEDIPKFKSFLDSYPNTVLQLAIWTGERRWGDPGYYLDQIIKGDFDHNIVKLAEACKNFGRPVYLRFGYEFDGYHNAYPPEKYKTAYKYFVDKMRALNVTNVAYVWHSWGVDAYYGQNDYPELYPPLSPNTEINQEFWYPGDDYVDWIGISIFGIGWGNLLFNKVIQWLIDFAETHEKPIMIAEAASIKTSRQSDPDWVIPSIQWFNNVFNLIDSRDVIKVFTYINVDWEKDNPSSTWGDTRIQATNSGFKYYWLEKIESFLHGDSVLYELINYNE